MRSEPESKIDGHVIALITARSGSKRVPEKNIRPIGGSSLLEIAITAAEAASGIHETAISTDSQAYLSLARDAGVDEEYLRPSELSGDQASSIDTVLHYLDWRDNNGKTAASHIVLLQPTSPFRRATHLDAAFEILAAAGRNSLVSLTPAAPNARYIVEHQADGLRVENDRPDTYVLDGSLFITQVDMLRAERRFWNEKSAAYINHYPRFFDIDSDSDFNAADALLSSNWSLEIADPGDHRMEL